MRENLIAQNYARAFLDKNQNPKIGNNLYKEICKIKKKIDTQEQSKTTIYTLIKQSYCSTPTHIFFILLKINKRFPLLQLINNYLYDLILRNKGILSIKVILCKELDNEMKEEIKTQINDLFTMRTTIFIQVDKRILSGMILKYHSQILNLSLSSQITTLYQALT